MLKKMMEEDDSVKIAQELQEAASTIEPPASASFSKESSPSPKVETGNVQSSATKDTKDVTLIDSLVKPVSDVKLSDNTSTSQATKDSFGAELEPDHKHPEPHIPCYLPATTAGPIFPGFPKPTLADPKLISADPKLLEPHIPCYLPATTAAPTFSGYPKPVLADTKLVSADPKQPEPHIPCYLPAMTSAPIFSGYPKPVLTDSKLVSADIKQPEPHIPCYLPATTAAPTFPGFPQPVLPGSDNTSPSFAHHSTNPYRAVTGLSTHVPATTLVVTPNLFTPPPITTSTHQQQYGQQQQQYGQQQQQYGQQQHYPYDNTQQFQQQFFQSQQPCTDHHHHQQHSHHQECSGEAFLEIPHDVMTSSWDNHQHSHDPYKSNDGFFGWVSNVGNKVIEKTKSSVETMITTLDPGMKAVICSGGDVDVMVTTTNEEVVGGVRQAFQDVFGKATVNGVESRSDIAPQPVGFLSGLKGAENKILNLRNSASVHERQMLVSCEPFIHEVFTDKWFYMECLTLKDPMKGFEVTTFTQAIPLHPSYVQQAQEFTAPDYELRWSGLGVTIGEIISRSQPHTHPMFWHKDVAGLTRRTMVYNAALSLATQYKNNSYSFHHHHHHDHHH